MKFVQGNGIRIGEITDVKVEGKDIIHVKLFHDMDSRMMKQYYIRPVTVGQYPLAATDELLELYQSNEVIEICCSSIVDFSIYCTTRRN